MIVCGPAYIPSTTPSSSYRGYLLRLDPDGSLDRSFSPRTSSGDGSDGFVTTAAAQPDGRILVVGYLQGARRLYRLNPDGSPDASLYPGPDLSVSLGVDYLDEAFLAVQNDGKILLAGGYEASLDPFGVLARYNADGSPDVDFNARVSVDGAVHVLTLQPDGKILLGGNFTRVNGAFRGGIARLNADGSFDNGFDSGGDSTNDVRSIVLQGDGQIFLAGAGTKPDNDISPAYSYIARIDANGRLDGSFVTGLATDSSVYAVALQADGRILVGGSFGFVNGEPRANLARLNNTVAAPVNAGTFSVVGTPTRGGFVVSRTGSTDAAATVLYHNGGSAIRDGDYVAFPGTLTFAAGQVEAVIPVRLLPGANRNKKVKVFLDPSPTGAYSIGKAQSKVFLSDL